MQRLQVFWFKKKASTDFGTEAANVTKCRAYSSIDTALHPREPESLNSRHFVGSREIIATLTSACLQTLSVQYNTVRFLTVFSRLQTNNCINFIKFWPVLSKEHKACAFKNNLVNAVRDIIGIYCDKHSINKNTACQNPKYLCLRQDVQGVVSAINSNLLLSSYLIWSLPSGSFLSDITHTHF